MKTTNINSRWRAVPLLALIVALLYPLVARPRSGMYAGCCSVGVCILGHRWSDPEIPGQDTNALPTMSVGGCPVDVYASGWNDDGCIAPNHAYASFSYKDVDNTGADVTRVASGPGWIKWRVANPTHPGKITFTAEIDKTQVSFQDYDGDGNLTNYCGPKTFKTTGTLEVVPGGGCCSDTSGSPSLSSATVDNNSVDFALALGRASAHGNAGWLMLRADTPSPALAQPVSLQLPFFRTNVDVVPGSGGEIRQVNAPEGLVNVAVVDEYQYQLQCFYATNVGSKVNGSYTTTGTPFATWVVRNPDGAAASNRLMISELRGSTERDFLYTYTASNNRWDLLKPDGQTLSTWSLLDPGDLSGNTTNCFRQVTVGSQLISKRQQTWQYVPGTGNRLLLQQIDGDGAVTQTTTNRYYTSGPAANKLQRVDYPDGRWSYYLYDWLGRITNEFSTYGNNLPPDVGTVPQLPQCIYRLTEYFYGLDGGDGVKVDNNGVTNDIATIPVITVVSVPVQGDSGWSFQEVSRTYDLSKPSERV
jgi:hypothetical protein